MTARKNGLPVQFNFLAFLPDILEASTRISIPRRCAAADSNFIGGRTLHTFRVGFGIYQRAQSISQHLWTMRPNGDAIELRSGNE